MAEYNDNNKQTGRDSSSGSQRSQRQSGSAQEGLSNYVFGKVQPQSLPLEEAVLGALMLDREALPMIMDILRPESFYLESHQLIYRAIIKLFERSNPVDLLTVTEGLRQSGDIDKVGGAYYLVELTNRVASAANIEYHARILAQKHIQRELIRVSTRTIKDAYEDTTDVFNLLDEAEKGLFGITQNNLSRSFESMGTLASKVLKQVEELIGKSDGLTGVPTGFTNLDRLTSGWQPSDLIILAARPGMGKTSFVLAMALNAAKDFNKPVALFSLEMASTQLVQRLISMEAEIPGPKMRGGKLEDWEWQQLQTTVEKLSSVPIFIDDTPGINIFELRAKCRRLKMQHDIQLIVIDYLQLMSGASENTKNGNREQEIAGISRALKGMAKELSVPVIALSQLSRQVEVRGGSKRPQLSDLRECVTGDTTVLLADGCSVPIAELVNKSVDVFSISPDNHKLTIQHADLVWPVGEKDVYEVKLASGKRIKATASHRLLAFECWKEVQDLKQGDRLAVARRLPEPENTITWPEEHVVLLGHLIGDGSYIKHQPLRYTTASEDNSAIVRHAAEKAFGVTVNRHVGRGNWHQLVFSGNGNRWHPAGMNLWLRELGIFGQRSHEKHLPSQVFQLENNQIALLLRHLWATDGTMYVPKNGRKGACRVAFSTNSHQLADNVALLLLRFGIVARIREVQQGNYRPMFSVDVSGVRDQRIFLTEVGAFGPKAEAAANMLAYLENTTSNTNIDTLPQAIFETVKAGMKTKGISHRGMANLRGTSYGGSAHFSFAPSREVLRDYATLLDDPALLDHAQSDIFWDTIISITHLGIEPVYDLTVPETQNWLANGGIVSHNSGAIEQDADIVSFIYRPEYYQILDDETGQSLKGVAEIIIAKHRNGALDTVRLRFTDHFAKFGNLEDPAFAGLSDPLTGPFTPSVIAKSSRMNEEDIPF